MSFHDHVSSVFQDVFSYLSQKYSHNYDWPQFSENVIWRHTKDFAGTSCDIPKLDADSRPEYFLKKLVSPFRSEKEILEKLGQTPPEEDLKKLKQKMCRVFFCGSAYNEFVKFVDDFEFTNRKQPGSKLIGYWLEVAKLAKSFDPNFKVKHSLESFIEMIVKHVKSMRCSDMTDMESYNNVLFQILAMSYIYATGSFIADSLKENGIVYDETLGTITNLFTEKWMKHLI